MKYDLSLIDTESFRLLNGEIAGDKVTLVTPLSLDGGIWDRNNLHLRSSIWTEKGELVSASMPKFFNLGERTDIADLPPNINDIKIIEKIDGSALIVSKYKGELIVRTRGSLSIQNFPNMLGDLKKLKQRYPKAFEFTQGTANYTRIFEYVTPDRPILIKYPELDMKLVAIVSHSDYSLLSQHKLDIVGEILGVPRPLRASFKDYNFLEELAHLSAIEGYCLYFNKDQSILKAKTKWYLTNHKLAGAYSRITKKAVAEEFDKYLQSEAYQLLEDKTKTFLAFTKEFRRTTDMDFETWEEMRPLFDYVQDHYKDLCESIVSLKFLIGDEMAYCDGQKMDKRAMMKYMSKLIGKAFHDQPVKKAMAFSIARKQDNLREQHWMNWWEANNTNVIAVTI